MNLKTFHVGYKIKYNLKLNVRSKKNKERTNLKPKSAFSN